MSALRDFAYVFLVSEKARRFGLLGKVSVPLVLTLSLSLPYILPGIRVSPVQTVAALAYEIAIAAFLAGFRRLLDMLKLVGAFILLGYALNLLSVLVGSEPSDPVGVALRTLRIAAIVIALTLLFQMLSISEVKYILMKLGLRHYSEVLAVAMAQLPLAFISFSEAYVVAKLKLGGKNVASLIKPLVVDSILNSRYVAEALYMHGVPPTAKPRALSPLDLVLLVPAAAISALHLVAT
ncbi:MAG: hypothetical protein RMH84_00225 [Sulfolobales archaeon]|nr:hypothetical protein [Sulfolobales archaeon]MDW8010014.1 hypothetical protein [Sulfolobales archaeon]